MGFNALNGNCGNDCCQPLDVPSITDIKLAGTNIVVTRADGTSTILDLAGLFATKESVQVLKSELDVTKGHVAILQRDLQKALEDVEQIKRDLADTNHRLAELDAYVRALPKHKAEDELLDSNGLHLTFTHNTTDM